MGLYLSTVIGFFVLLIVTLLVSTYYLKKALHSEDSVTIDPLPTKAAGSSKETVA